MKFDKLLILNSPKSVVPQSFLSMSLGYIFFTLGNVKKYYESNACDPRVQKNLFASKMGEVP